MNKITSHTPKVFISYSWSSKSHVYRVLNLAEKLEEKGVHVVIDKWDLPDGSDRFFFMERMVTDKSIDKVVVVCDRIYTEKAEKRSGGVGTESQIISQEIYDQINPADRNQKFVALVTEKDDSGKPYLPAFLKSRIYIDISDPDTEHSGFEQLLRWLYNKPRFQRPERGRPPAFLFQDMGKIDSQATETRHANMSQYDLATFLRVEYGISNILFLSSLKHANSSEEFLDQVFADIKFKRYEGPIFDLIKLTADLNEIRNIFGLTPIEYDNSKPYRIVRLRMSIGNPEADTT